MRAPNHGAALAGAIALAAAAGCYAGAGTMGDTPGSSSGAPTVDGSGASTGDTGLPCDVAQLLQSKCQSCHGATPSGGAPMSLVTYADLTAAAKSDATKTVVQLSITRMQSTTAPMPPGGGPSPASDVSILQAWVTAGMPKGSCGATGGSGAVDPCASGRTYSGGEGSSSMNPGQACISCHQRSGGEAPSFSIAGTVYQTAHEPDMCDGVAGSGGAVTVVITDANGTQLTLSVNGAGNFSSRGAIAMPYSAKVVANGKERAMSATQTSGDCNSCHTVSGANGAPGRIMAP